MTQATSMPCRRLDAALGASAEGLWRGYQALLYDPMAPALCFVHPASARLTGPGLLSLDLIDYGTRKCVNAALTGTLLLTTAPFVLACGMSVHSARRHRGLGRLLAVPVVIAVGLAVGCMSGVTNFGVRGMGALFGAAAALMGAASLPIDVAGRALEALAQRCV